MSESADKFVLLYAPCAVYQRGSVQLRFTREQNTFFFISVNKMARVRGGFERIFGRYMTGEMVKPWSYKPQSAL